MNNATPVDFAHAAIARANMAPSERVESADIDQSRLRRALEIEVSKAGVCSAIARVTVGGHTIFAGGAGVRSSIDPTPVAADTPFRSASVTKLFTAATVLRLAERGVLMLDDPIGPFLPAPLADRLHVLSGVNSGARLTIRQLLSHSTGLADIDADPAFNGAIERDPSRVWAPEELLEFAIRRGPTFAPGSSQAYSSANYMTLGIVVAAVTGKPYHVVVREEVITPLQLEDTFEEANEGRGPRPIASSFIGDLDTTLASPSFEYADGGFVTTTADLVEFGRALARGALFSHPETLASMLTAPGNGQIGLGPFLADFEWEGGTEQILFHYGYWGVMLMVFPKRDAAIAMTVNQSESNYTPLLSELVGAVLRATSPTKETGRTGDGTPAR